MQRTHWLYLGFEHDEALRAIDRALALNPNSTKSLNTAGWIRAYAGDGTPAIEYFQRALRLNPLDPELGYLLSGLSLAYQVAGQHEESLKLREKALRESPNWISGSLDISGK